jgi:hypothetical protein
MLQVARAGLAAVLALHVAHLSSVNRQFVILKPSMSVTLRQAAIHFCLLHTLHSARCAVLAMPQKCQLSTVKL